MDIAILGSGGVGGTYGGCLARAGHAVRLWARGEHLAAIRQRGLTVHTPEESFTVSVAASDRAEELAGVELAVVAVKTYSLEEVAPVARLLAERGAVVLPLLNGVEAADRLAALGVPVPALLGGLTMISAERTGPGEVRRRSTFQRVVLGELGGGSSPRVERIAEAFRSAGIESRASTDIQLELWEKLVFIASLATVCGLARTAIGAVRSAPHGHAFIAAAVNEAVAVGRARGVRFGEEVAPRVIATVEGLAEGMRPSFLLDLERGGPTELDALMGALARMGAAAGVPTPVHSAATAALSAALSARASGSARH
ncbi:MAG TPA: ketopantoate reductase family protein [Myxococcaceae bacterium]|nr:ketopantoate reductase family protein [Myxococcaceae bacterium]